LVSCCKQMENKGYIIVDGSHLLSSIHELWRVVPEFKDRKLDLGKLSLRLQEKWQRYMSSIVRTIFYFKPNESRLETLVIIPEANKPGLKSHWIIKKCGQGLSNIPDDELIKISPEYRDHFSRSEKGLDVKLVCDVLSFLTSKVASNFVFLVNDRDYIPLFESVEQLGGNVYLTSLHSELHIQKSLAEMSDMYLTLDEELEFIFESIQKQV